MIDKPLSLLESLREMQKSMPMYLELIKIQAELKRVKFLELKNQGFTDDQAIELCKGIHCHESISNTYSRH